MMKGSENSGSSASKSLEPIAPSGLISCVPDETTVTYTRSNAGEGSYQTTSRTSYRDKQSGCYGSVTKTEKASAGKFEWKNGTTGTRTEYKNTSTYRVGNKSGYTEVYNEQRVRDVSYDKNVGSKNLITYDKGDGGAYGGGGHGYGDSDSDSDSDSDYAYGGYGYGHGGGGYGYGYDSDSDY